MNQPTTSVPDPDGRPPSGPIVGQPSTGRTTATIAALAQAFNAAERSALVILDTKRDR